MYWNLKSPIRRHDAAISWKSQVIFNLSKKKKQQQKNIFSNKNNKQICSGSVCLNT